MRGVKRYLNLYKLVGGIFLVICTVAIAGSVSAQDFTAVRQLAERRVPWLSPHLLFEKIPSNTAVDNRLNDKVMDAFELFSNKGKVVIRASSASAAAMGLNWYLKYYCHRSMSHLGDNLSKVNSLPVIEGVIKQSTPFSIRYALNYCTLSYSMSFYRWSDWERELDWMALNGFNLMLMPVGITSVWQHTLQKIGFTDHQIASFIPGPAFIAWWLMGNLEGWGGPQSQQMIHIQAALAKKIITRMKGLGIQPVVQGFYGMVPTSLKQKYPDAAIKVQGGWSGGFTRPDVLLPQDSLFGKIAAIYYQELKNLYGHDLHYFAGDLFHEGGATGGIDLAATAGLVQKTLAQNYPDATWVLQAWQSNPQKVLLEGLDRRHVLIVELLGEHATRWDVRKGFEGTPFVLCPVGNFGEKVGIFGRLGYFTKEIYEARQSNYRDLMRGVGVMPEGIDNNVVLYDLIAETAWRPKSIDLEQWISGYIQYRYGVINTDLKQAWRIFLRTVYDSLRVSPDGPPESIFCARPDTNLQIASTYGTLKRAYDTALFAQGVQLLLRAEQRNPSLRSSKTYQTDKIDFIRQVNANRGLVLFVKVLEAIKQKNLVNFKTAYGSFRKALLRQNSLLLESPYFSLSRWLNQAKAFGQTAADQKLAVRNAREQISYWGPDNNPGTDLHDYANKEWGGLLSTLYLRRWDAFYNYQSDLLEGKKGKEKPDYYLMEVNWANETINNAVKGSSLKN